MTQLLAGTKKWRASLPVRRISSRWHTARHQRSRLGGGQAASRSCGSLCALAPTASDTPRHRTACRWFAARITWRRPRSAGARARGRWRHVVAGLWPTRQRLRCAHALSVWRALHRPTKPRSSGSDIPLAYRIIPPATATRDPTALESTMQALALPGSPRKRALALELMGTPAARGFIVRGATVAAVDDAALQLRAQYPQAELQPLPPVEDPLRLAPGETVAIRELRTVGEPFLSLRTWMPKPTARPQEGADPLLGLLAALDHVPEGLRAVAQLALVPAPEAWSTGYERQADRASLQSMRLEAGLRARERMQAETLRDTSGLPLPLLILGLLGCLGWLWWRRMQLGASGRWPWMPQPLYQALAAALRQQRGATAVIVAVLVGGCFLLLGLLGIVVIRRLRYLPPFLWLHRPTRVYDPDRIMAKTQQPAYRARLRLIVISPTGQTPEQEQENRALRALALERLTAAYRQFHLAGGAHFASTTLAKRTARRLLPRAPSGNGRPAGQRSAWTRDLARSTDLLSLAEVATLWHLPQACDITDLAWLRDEERARTILAPSALALRPGERHPDEQKGRRTQTPRSGPRTDREAQREQRDDTTSPQSAIAAHPSSAAPLVLGHSRHAGQDVLVQAPPDVITRHTLAVAKTGKGKSTLLLLLARLALAGAPNPTTLPPPGHARRGVPSSRAWEGHSTETSGLLLIDPHGDLAQAFLGLVPPHRQDDVVLVDLADTAYPIALNPLDVTLGRERDKAVENLLLVFAHIWARFWGPRMENALEFALKTLYEANRALVEQDPQQGPDLQFTLLDVAPILSIPSFRHRLLGLVRDPSLLAWWAQYFEPLDLRMQLEIINPVLTKLAKFSSSQVARRIVGQGRSTLDLARVINDGQVLLVNTARGHVGADTAALVGATLLGLLSVTLEEQARRATETRRRIAVLVDEFQLMPGADYGSMLAELRKFGASFVLATQALTQLDAVDRELRPTVLANIDNLFAFAVSADDARLLIRELDDVVTERDLINLPSLSAYAKLTWYGRRLPVFSVDLEPPSPGDANLREMLVQASRARIARPVAAVDALLAELAARHTPPRHLDTWVRVAAEGLDASGPARPGVADGGTTRTRRNASRRRGAVDPLAIVGIPPRRRSSRTAPFDFTSEDAPRVDSASDAAVHRSTVAALTASWQPGNETDTAGQVMARAEAASPDDGADPGEGAAGAPMGPQGTPRLKKRQRGSRGGARHRDGATDTPGATSGTSGLGNSGVGSDVAHPASQTGAAALEDESGTHQREVAGPTTDSPAAASEEYGQNRTAHGGDAHG